MYLHSAVETNINSGIFVDKVAYLNTRPKSKENKNSGNVILQHQLRLHTSPPD